MTQDPQSRSRREFLKAASAAVAGAALGGMALPPARGAGGAARPAFDPSKVLNYNPRMGYRRLGKTGFMISEVSLGGHGKGHQFLEHAVELGMNYVDTNIVGECDTYGRAMAATTSARRDQWFIGFASWGIKITEDYEKNLTPQLLMNAIEGRLKSYRTDVLDLWRPVGATWGPGQNAVPTLLMVSKKALEMVAGVFEKARQAGKVRHLGLSAHNPKVFRRVLEEYPQFEVIIFPYLFLTKEMGGESLLALAKEKDVGVIGLKPFGAGSTFGVKRQQNEAFTDQRGRIMVREMLKEPRLSAVIPGIGAKEHLDENVRGSYERDRPDTAADRAALEDCRRNFYAHLPPEYQWLRQWETV
jgi:hypothetical protein